jgi:iron complex outermembrane receptor protein
LSRASDWIDYDRISLAAASVQNADAALPYGPRLRDYWLNYSGLTRLRGVFARDISGIVALQIAGENLFNQQRGEPDNATIVPGRTITVGVKIKR